MIPAQCKMARMALDWLISDLAQHAEVGTATIGRFKSGKDVNSTTISALTKAFEDHGIKFISDNEASLVGGRKEVSVYHDQYRIYSTQNVNEIFGISVTLSISIFYNVTLLTAKNYNLIQCRKFADWLNQAPYNLRPKYQKHNLVFDY